MNGSASRIEKNMKHTRQLAENIFHLTATFSLLFNIGLRALIQTHILHREPSILQHSLLQHCIRLLNECFEISPELCVGGIGFDLKKKKSPLRERECRGCIWGHNVGAAPTLPDSCIINAGRSVPLSTSPPLSHSLGKLWILMPVNETRSETHSAFSPPPSPHRPSHPCHFPSFSPPSACPSFSPSHLRMLLRFLLTRNTHTHTHTHTQKGTTESRGWGVGWWDV